MPGKRHSSGEARVSGQEQLVQGVQLVADGFHDGLAVDGRGVEQDVQQRFVGELPQPRYAGERQSPDLAVGNFQFEKMFIAIRLLLLHLFCLNVNIKY